VFVLPSDQPLISADDLIELVSAFKKRPTGNVVVPVVNEKRGNPILLDQVALEEILSSDANLACRHFIDKNPALVHIYETGNTHFVTDLDTPADMQALAEKTGWRFEMPVKQADELSTDSQTPVALPSI
jgi:molybdenum cofactor cytidylyltransferase